jgi:hypothetical protein
MLSRAKQILTYSLQIEQFIETLFPSQNVKQVKSLHAEKVSNSESSGDFWESLMLVAAVLFFLLLVSGLMVRTLWLSLPLREILGLPRE